MTITDENTVLVIGAGVSVPFGLPLGGQLIDQIASAIKLEHQHIFSDERFKNSKLTSAVKRADMFQRLPIYGTALTVFYDTTNNYFLSDANVELRKLYELFELLQDQTSETIDDFIVENSDYAHIAKIAIASIFMKKCYNFDSNKRTPKPFHVRQLPELKKNHSNRNWVHLLINIIRQGIRTGIVNKDNKIKFITFNYDTILEYVLDKQFSNTQAPYENWTNYIDIIHVHGACGKINEKNQASPQSKCLEWASGIHVVNEENVPDNIQQNRNQAKELIQSAKEIYFAGFSFAAPNCRMLGLDQLKAKHEESLISVSNYDGNVGISRILKKIEQNSYNEIPAEGSYPNRESVITPSKLKYQYKVDEAFGSAEKPLSIVDWLRLGYLGELPG